MKTLLIHFSLLLMTSLSISRDKDNGPTGTSTWICGNTLYHAAKIYRTVQIGSQCWMKENLNVGAMIVGSDTSENNGIIEKYCYNDDTANCGIYGGLYQWNEAMQYTKTVGARGICPEGWHIPTLAEFETLRKTADNDGNALKEIGQGTLGGVGTNMSGFSALIAGLRVTNGSFNSLSYDAYFWSSTESSSQRAYYLLLFSCYIYPHDSFKTYGFSVRCLKD